MGERSYLLIPNLLFYGGNPFNVTVLILGPLEFGRRNWACVSQPNSHSFQLSHSFPVGAGLSPKGSAFRVSGEKGCPYGSILQFG